MVGWIAAGDREDRGPALVEVDPKTKPGAVGKSVFAHAFLVIRLPQTSEMTVFPMVVAIIA